MKTNAHLYTYLVLIALRQTLCIHAHQEGQLYVSMPAKVNSTSPNPEIHYRFHIKNDDAFFPVFLGPDSPF